MAHFEIRLHDDRITYVDGDRVEHVPGGTPAGGQSAAASEPGVDYLLVWKNNRVVAWFKDARVVGEDADHLPTV